MNSEELIDNLLKGLIEDSTYRVNGIPHDLEERRGLVRSLMNVRDARPIPPDLLRIQDEYLEERRKELGTVSVEDIPAIEESLGSTGPFSDRISVWRGDITLLGCDAIVNAANCYMLGCFQPCHACIDNCIHTYAGMQMRLECDAFMRGRTPGYTQPTSIPLVTDAYHLPCRKVVHVVGPIIEDRLTEEHERQLGDCYTNVLDACKANSLRTVAFCCISTGVFRFPNERAAEIAVSTVKEWLKKNPDSMDRVIFDVFLEKDERLYKEILGDA